MARTAALFAAALSGLLIAGCGTFGQTGVAVPRPGDDVQTVSDAVNSMVHRVPATDNAKAAIAVTDALGSVVRDLGDDDRFLSDFSRYARRGASIGPRDGFVRTSSRLSTPLTRGVTSISQLVMRPSVGSVAAYCQSSAGFSVNGIPSLDTTFGWQSGAYSGGTRMVDGLYSTWSVNATGVAVQAPIGGLAIARSAGASCPMMAPAFSIRGGTSSDAFSIPMTLTYRRGTLWDLSISNAEFASGESLDVTTSNDRRPSFDGAITKGSTELALFHTNDRGDGKLTITSTGAQYAITSWIVVSI